MKTLLPATLLLFLVSPPIATASTPEINNLEAFHQKAAANANAPITEAERTKQLRDLSALSRLAQRSSSLLLERDIRGANMFINDIISRTQDEFARSLQEINDSYREAVEAIEKRADAAVQQAEAKANKDIQKINREATERLRQCKDSACRRNVENWRKQSVAAAVSAFQDKKREIVAQAASNIKEEAKLRERAIEAVLEDRDSVIADLERERERLLSEVNTRARERAAYISVLNKEAAQFIRSRPAA